MDGSSLPAVVVPIKRTAKKAPTSRIRPSKPLRSKKDESQKPNDKVTESKLVEKDKDSSKTDQEKKIATKSILKNGLKANVEEESIGNKSPERSVAKAKSPESTITDQEKKVGNKRPHTNTIQIGNSKTQVTSENAANIQPGRSVLISPGKSEPISQGNGTRISPGKIATIPPSKGDPVQTGKGASISSGKIAPNQPEKSASILGGNSIKPGISAINATSIQPGISQRPKSLKAGMLGRTLLASSKRAKISSNISATKISLPSRNLPPSFQTTTPSKDDSTSKQITQESSHSLSKPTKETEDVQMVEDEEDEGNDQETSMILRRVIPGTDIPLPPVVPGVPTMKEFCSKFQTEADEEKLEKRKLRRKGRKSSETWEHPRSTRSNTVQPQPSPSETNAASANDGPMVEVINGEIVIRETSLVVGNKVRTIAEVDAEMEAEIVEEEGDRTRLTAMYNSYVVRDVKKKWEPDTTRLFFKALQVFGLDFTSMSIDPDFFGPKDDDPQDTKQSQFVRTRTQLRNKYRIECRQNPHLIDLIMRGEVQQTAVGSSTPKIKRQKPVVVDADSSSQNEETDLEPKTETKPQLDSGSEALVKSPKEATDQSPTEGAEQGELLTETPVEHSAKEVVDPKQTKLDARQGAKSASPIDDDYIQDSKTDEAKAVSHDDLFGEPSAPPEPEPETDVLEETTPKESTATMPTATGLLSLTGQNLSVVKKGARPRVRPRPRPNKAGRGPGKK